MTSIVSSHYSKADDRATIILKPIPYYLLTETPRFYTKEYSNPSLRPVLNIIYSTRAILDIVELTGDSNWDDTYVDEQNPDINYGSSYTISIGQSNAGYAREKKAAFMFDISAIPDDATIVTATLYLYRKGTDSYGSDGCNVNIYESNDLSWIESGVTWNNFIEEFADRGDVIFEDASTGSEHNGWIGIDITPIANSKHTDLDNKVTIILDPLPHTTYSETVRFSSTEDSANQPYAEIVYMK